MKISKSKKQLAKIIHENEGWVDGAEFSAQDKDGEVFHYATKPSIDKGSEVWGHKGCIGHGDFPAKTLPNWFQCILSRDEYFHLYPAPDAEGWIEWCGGECPVDGNEIIDIRYPESREEFGAKAKFRRWNHARDKGDIIAYRLHKTEPEIQSEIMGIAQIGDINVVESKPAIEQLAAEYRNLKDFADRKQQEAGAAKVDAEAKLAELVAAGKALGLALSVTDAESKPELVIIDWRDLRVGDVVWYGGDDELSSGEYYVMEIESPDYEGYRTVLVNGGYGGHWIDTRARWGLIRRPT